MYSLKEEKISQITPFSVLADNKRIRNKTIDGKSTQATRSGKNYFDASKIANTNIVVSDNGKTIKMPIATIGNGFHSTSSTLQRLCPNLNVGDEVYLFLETTSNINNFIYLTLTSYAWIGNTLRTITQADLDSTVILYGNRYDNGETEQVIISNLMITKENDNTWEQYGASPSPEFPSEIKSVGDEGTVTIEQRGKNLFSNKFEDYYKPVDYYVCPIKLEKGKTYKIWGELVGKTVSGYYVGVVPYGEKYSEFSAVLTGAVNSKGVPEERTFTVTEAYTSPKLVIYLGSYNYEENFKSMFENYHIQLEEQDKTDYEPYFSKDYVLPLSEPLRSLPNGTKDTIEEDGIHRRVGSKIFDGSDDETWSETANVGQFYTTVLNNIIKPNSSLYCSHLKAVTGWGTDNSIFVSSLGNIGITIPTITTTTDLKAWLQQNPITVQYELAEEVVEPFTEEQLEVINSMKTFEGVNYFSLAGDLQTTLTFDYNPKITEEIKRAFKYNITKAYLEVAATDKSSGFQINEDNYLQSIDFDDCRYIEGEGIIGSCVAKELQGKFVNVDTSFDIENRELDCFIGAETEDNITHYLRLGTFIVQKPENDNVKDNTSFDSLDYMIKFNKEYVHRMAKYLKTKDIDIIKDKQYYILTESGAYEEVIVPHKEEISNYYELIDEYTLMQLLKDICEQCEVKLGTFDFRNANYVVHGNRFDTGTTCRDVLKAIAQAAFSWARINEYNELLLDFETSDTITEEIDYNEYYNLSFNDKYGPVNTIVLKNSQVEGENITVQDETLVKNYGIKELAISDNPFAYSEETRKAIIEAGKMLYGFTYVPLTVETIGAAYLNCKDKIKVKNMQDGDLETYLFDTRISYQGTLKSNVETLAMTDTETKYRYDGSLTTAQRRTEYRVDKAEQKMTSLVKLTTEQGEKLTEAVQDLDGFKRTIINKTDETNEKITTIEETVNGLVTEKSVSGGQNLIKNSVGYFGNDYWQINETTEGKVLNDNSTDVKQNSISGSALKLQAETIYQDIKEIKNGEYYLSFNYKRIINTAIATLKVNDLIINLTEENWKEEAHLINVTTNNIRIEITTDLNSSILITDLMLTEGNIKVSWTQNANESYTDTVQIGKGVRITATGSDTEFVAEATGITINNTETGGKVAEFTKYGTETQELIAHKDVKVADSLLIQKIGNQTWFSSL